MNRTRKRNNFTLSEEAQKIVDKIPSYKKSRFVSEAIVKHDTALIIISGTVAGNKIIKG